MNCCNFNNRFLLIYEIEEKIQEKNYHELLKFCLRALILNSKLFIRHSQEILKLRLLLQESTSYFIFTIKRYVLCSSMKNNYF